MPAQRVVVVIPAYNEERTIVEVIRGLKQRGFTTLIVVDDGSSDRTSELASYKGVIILRHIIFRIHLMLDRLEQEVTEIVRAIALEHLKEPKGPSFEERTQFPGSTPPIHAP
jgi:cellulose synthase/poly-beta-1,6-N-acetylglucosamine synthase-like glycosyltransferase